MQKPGATPTPRWHRCRDYQGRPGTPPATSATETETASEVSGGVIEAERVAAGRSSRSAAHAAAESAAGVGTPEQIRNGRVGLKSPREFIVGRCWLGRFFRPPLLPALERVRLALRGRGHSKPFADLRRASFAAERDGGGVFRGGHAVHPSNCATARAALRSCSEPPLRIAASVSVLHQRHLYPVCSRHESPWNE